eukprot:1157096-Pelagomonas_calceolata.AAC.10
MLYADDLMLTANDPSTLQTMLNRLDVYAWKKLILNSKVRGVTLQLLKIQSACVLDWWSAIGS